MYVRNFECIFLAFDVSVTVDSYARLTWLFLGVSTCTALTHWHACTRTDVHAKTLRWRKSVSLTVFSLLPTGNLALTTTDYPRCRPQSWKDWAPWRKSTYIGVLTLTWMTSRQNTWGVLFRICIRLVCASCVWIVVRCVFYVSVGIYIHIVCMFGKCIIVVWWSTSTSFTT